MKTAEQTLLAARQSGLLPADAMLPAQDERPWPVLLLTAVGAWFAAVPLMIMIGMLLGDVLRRGVGPYFVGVLVLLAAVVVMRSRDLPLFVEQLAVPALLVGGGMLVVGLYRDLSTSLASLLMLAVTLGVAWAIPKTWLRVLLGAAAAALLGLVLMPLRWNMWRADIVVPWLVLHALLLAWGAALWLQQQHLLRGRLAREAALLEALAAGWLLLVLAGLAWLSGMSFMVGGSMGELSREVVNNLTPRLKGEGLTMQAGSVLMALAATWLAVRAWAGLMGWLPLAVAAVLAGLGWFVPALGGVLLAAAVCCTTQRWRLASAAAFVAAWVLGSFYYQLQWPLATKALVLAGAGGLLGALAWLAPAWRASRVDHGGPARPGPAAWAMLAGGLLTLLVANGAIWQKQDLIARGRPVFVALAPVDPRSLMQGDFMRLNFGGAGFDETPLLQALGSARPKVVARIDARGVATVLRGRQPEHALAADELLIELTPKDGRWILVADAWFFREGDGERWAQARFGEFRVQPDGRALLVGMADADLKPIKP
ncbi:GDYXXLXY domain-containing protein [Roseateles toxinivorans]|uniref:Putative membrane-anchored protein n=1 Tax=Roseateles toxinivorans TaxID=270368 RepID=A0A4V3CTJ0_9BURK|nr:GDYXXLXY domain-containing protein [Roseateles toxinivorans]TDP72494.1 putative membrane-anchored protein [Roseateles toxinivorans]